MIYVQVIQVIPDAMLANCCVCYGKIRSVESIMLILSGGFCWIAVVE